MGEKTQENSGMGYSVAYPTGRERCRFSSSFELEFKNGIGDCWVRGFDRIEIGREGEI